MVQIFLRALAVWLVLVVLAILNGTLRVAVLIPLLGEQLAFPLSGLLLSLLILCLALIAVPFLRLSTPGTAWGVGLFWLLLTIAFEFGFGHYVMGQPWDDILAAYDITTGNLWLVVLVVTVIAPYAAGKLRNTF